MGGKSAIEFDPFACYQLIHHKISKTQHIFLMENAQMREVCIRQDLAINLALAHTLMHFVAWHLNSTHAHTQRKMTFVMVPHLVQCV